MSDPSIETPSLPLLMKLGSIAVHTEELLSPNGHVFDKSVIESLLNDPEVKTWLEEMSKRSLVPKKR